MHIKIFSTFLNEKTTEILKKFAEQSGKYIEFKILPKGDLKISLTDEGKIEVEKEEESALWNRTIGNFDFVDFFDDIRGNSEWEYTHDLSQYGFFVETPALLHEIEYEYDNDEPFINIYENGDVFYFPFYQSVDFLDELIQNGYVIFKHLVVSPKEQEEYDLKKVAGIYNI